MAVRVWNRTIDPSASFAGTLTCIAGVADDPTHRVALTAAHVLAPLSLPDGISPQENDDIVFEIAGSPPLLGKLWSWVELQRKDGGFSNRFDAALVTIRDADANALIAALNQPASVADPKASGTLRFDGISSHGSGMFDGLPATDPLIYPILGGGLASVAFVGSLRARVTSASGDSGSLMTCDAQGVGMLVAHEGSMSRFLPLKPLLSEFNLAWPGEVGEAALANASAAAPQAAASADALETLARTLWGEARGEPLSGIRAVAAVVMNRATHPTVRWWGTDVISVCRAGKQFSCWNGNDPNLPQLLAIDESDDKFRLCTGVARDALQDRLQIERLLRATHYHNKKVAPDWARGKVPCADIRNHLFYNNIEG